MFALAGVEAEQAIVVDDTRENARRARALGALAVLVDPAGEATPEGVDAVTTNIVELPDALRHLP